MIDYYYFDTSIWIDIYDKRGYNVEMACKLLEKIIKDDAFVIYSDIVIHEFKKVGFSDLEIQQILSIAKPDHIKRIHSTADQLRQANKVSKQRVIPLRDAAHAILARDCEAQLVSLDWHFKKVRDITLAKIPIDLL